LRTATPPGDQAAPTTSATPQRPQTPILEKAPVILNKRQGFIYWGYVRKEALRGNPKAREKLEGWAVEALVSQYRAVKLSGTLVKRCATEEECKKEAVIENYDHVLGWYAVYEQAWLVMQVLDCLPLNDWVRILV
jgi:hypothetical protein